MEKYFKPVHSPSNPDKSKTQKRYNQHQHHHQEPGSHRYTARDDADRNTDESYGHRYDQHGHYYHNNVCPDVHICHQTKQFPHREEEFVYNHTNESVILSRASSSSLSSSSTSLSSTSWFTEASANDVFSQRHAERPQHSLSCSNIHDARRFSQLDDNTDPIVFATIKHGSNGNVCSEIHGASLDRAHSQSNEGFLQENERKTTKSYLNRSLGFSEEDIMLGVSKGPKRAVSSSQLPGKGILKNKKPHLDIRKAKSMEVLSPRVAKERPGGQKEKGITQVDMKQSRAHFVKEKIKFSAFLDEITKQVISPSDLNILGVSNNKTTGQTPFTQTPDPIKPQLPPKQHRQSSVEEKEQKQNKKHIKTANSSTQRDSDSANSDRLCSYVARNHHGSPPPNSAYTSHSTQHKSSCKDRRLTCTEDSGDRYRRSGPHLTDGTSSPELIQPRQWHKPQPTSQSPLSRLQHSGPANSLLSSTKGAGVGLGSESSSSKPDSSRTRDTISTATSSDQGSRYSSQHAALSEQHRGTQCEADLEALQEENADLHQNLLQTVVCIESLEAELQQTRDELIHVKEKYKSLLETHSGTQQANSLLQEHLHAEAESLSSERQYMFNHVAQLTSELQDAHRTISALENINVPSLIKELLEKHFFTSAEAQQQPATTQFSHLMSSPKTDNQPCTPLHTPKVEETSHDWSSKSEAGPQRPTAFTPFKLLPTTENQSWISGSHSTCSPLFSVADISTAIFKKMAAGYATRPQPLCPQPLLGTTTADNPSSSVQQASVGGDNCAGKGGVNAVLSEQAVENVTAMSAQKILNDFMQQLQAQKKPDRDLKQQEEWGAEAAEQTGKVDKS